MLRKILDYIDSHPRLILLGSWPVYTAVLLFIICIVWLGPWPNLIPIALKRLDILGWIAGGVSLTMILNQLAQSSTFFGRLAVKVGDFANMSVDMPPAGAIQTQTQTNTQTTVVKNELAPANPEHKI